MNYCKTLLHIYHAPAQDRSKPHISQKNMDIILLVVSISGLVSAFSFLLTITR